MTDVSVQGLEDFNKRFLNGDKAPTEVKGAKLKPEALRKYEEERLEDFIKRAGGMTEDLLAFIIDERKKRSMSDAETVFAVALACINLRNAYGAPQNPDEQKDFSDEKAKALLKEFDEICYNAQQYWDANT